MMDSTVIGAFIGIVFLTIVNVAVVAFSYGRLTQKVNNLCDRFEDHLEEHRQRGGK